MKEGMILSPQLQHVWTPSDGASMQNISELNLLPRLLYTFDKTLITYQTTHLKTRGV